MSPKNQVRKVSAKAKNVKCDSSLNKSSLIADSIKNGNKALPGTVEGAANKNPAVPASENGGVCFDLDHLPYDLALHRSKKTGNFSYKTTASTLCCSKKNRNCTDKTTASTSSEPPYKSTFSIKPTPPQTSKFSPTRELSIESSPPFSPLTPPARTWAQLIPKEDRFVINKAIRRTSFDHEEHRASDIELFDIDSDNLHDSNCISRGTDPYGPESPPFNSTENQDTIFNHNENESGYTSEDIKLPDALSISKDCNALKPIIINEIVIDKETDLQPTVLANKELTTTIPSTSVNPKNNEKVDHPPITTHKKKQQKSSNPRTPAVKKTSTKTPQKRHRKMSSKPLTYKDPDYVHPQPPSPGTIDHHSHILSPNSPRESINYPCYFDQMSEEQKSRLLGEYEMYPRDGPEKYAMFIPFKGKGGFENRTGRGGFDGKSSPNVWF